MEQRLRADVISESPSAQDLLNMGMRGWGQSHLSMSHGTQ